MSDDVLADGAVVVRRRLAAYAVVLRDEHVLLTQLSQRTGWPGLWTLPGGGIDHGEDPRQALLREVMEETGQLATLGGVLDVNAEHSTSADPHGVVEDYQSVRLLFAATVPVDARPPCVLEVDGSTAAAAWHPVDDVLNGVVPVVPVVGIGLAALAAHEPVPRAPAVRAHQRLAAYAVVLRDDAVLLTRISASGHHVGSWTLPGGGVEHGEDPRAAVVREVAEETGLVVDTIEYVASQPWPFPASLMLGFRARCDPDAVPHPVDGELEDARWFTRDEVRSAVTWGAGDQELQLPSAVSIARLLIDGWLAEG